MPAKEMFSKRFCVNEEPAVTIHNDAPDTFRVFLVDIADTFGLNGHALRELVCKQLHKRADVNNYHDWHIKNEIHDLLHECPWFKVYDILEDIASQINQVSQDKSPEFETEINEFFKDHGIGWRLIDRKVLHRLTDGIDYIYKNAVAAENSQGYPTAANELREAIKDMSRRPVPDVTGAVQHAMTSLECVARDTTASKKTLGDWIKENPDFFPTPLNKCVQQLYGYACEHGRHLRNSAEPSMDEAELVLGLSAALGAYLSKKGVKKTKGSYAEEEILF